MRRVLGLCLLLLCFCAAAHAEQLVVYTSHKEEVYQPIIEEFERRTGIWVRVVAGGTTELLARIAKEADQPTADVMFGGGVESLMAYGHYFAPCDLPRDALLADCRFEGLHFVTFSRLPLVIIYNPRLISSPPAGWADLLTQTYTGQIAFASPDVSGSSLTALATIWQTLGETAAMRFAAQVRGCELPSSGDVIGAVASGAMPVGVTLEETAVKRMLAGDHIAIVWPCEGTSAVPDGAAVIAGCTHEAGAQAFLRFILGEDVQRRVQTDYARASVLAAVAGETVLSAERPLCAYDIDWSAANRQRMLTAWHSMMEVDMP